MQNEKCDFPPPKLWISLWICATLSIIPLILATIISVALNQGMLEMETAIKIAKLAKQHAT